MKESKRSRFGRNISIINRAAQGYFYHALSGLDIGPGQQAYLLSLLPGEVIVQEELAIRLHVDKANVTRALKGLLESGFIRRTRCQKDRRAWEISLTESGIEMRKRIEAFSIDWVNRLRRPLSEEEWEKLEGYIEKIAESLEEP